MEGAQWLLGVVILAMGFVFHRRLLSCKMRWATRTVPIDRHKHSR